MMSLEAIRDANKQAVRKAKKLGKRPKVFTADDLKPENVFEAVRSIPNLGDFLPPGYKRVDLSARDGEHGLYLGDNDGCGAYMVDSSGFGRKGEPALTVQEFIDTLKPGLGYGIVEEGQFQVKIGVFAVKYAENRRAA